jgi:diaminopimelate epimerase
MKIDFVKYHGTGNDFILIDNRMLNLHLDHKAISFICNRHYGIGADGLIYLDNDEKLDFGMKYFNADGKEGTMCGNGGRCITAFAAHLGLIDQEAIFSSIDGKHHSRILSRENELTQVTLQLKDVDNIKRFPDYYFLDTGSPHYVKFVKNIESVDVLKEGKKIRWDQSFQPEGTNVNFVEIKDEALILRTYERGVENITLSCGTGATATAIAAFIELNGKRTEYKIETLGGQLDVKFQHHSGKFSNIWLTGAAQKVFEGSVQI